MKKTLRHVFFALAILASLGLAGCSKHGNQPRQQKQKFQVVSLDNVRGSIGEPWNITLTIANNTASNVRITSASAYINHNGRKFARVILDKEVLLPRRRCSQVEVPLRITLSNPIAALGLLNKVRKGDYSGVTVDYSVSVSALASHRIFEEQGVTLEQLARQFNLGLKK